MKNKFDKILMQTAELWATMSYCKRLQVGAVLSKDGRILATGYNGTVTGTENNCEEPVKYVCPKCGDDVTDLVKGERTICKRCETAIGYFASEYPYFKMYYPLVEPELKTNELTVHAEQNVITFCAKNGIKTDGTTLYVTHSPCKNCAKLIVQSGIVRVVYKNEYRDTEGIDFLKKVGVEVEKI